jgi:uncharacterized protein YbjQ (UPF0145 family)
MGNISIQRNHAAQLFGPVNGDRWARPYQPCYTYGQVNGTEKGQRKKGSSMDLSMTTTTFELDGHRMVKNLGVVRGITVRSRSIFGTIGATLETIVGGNITLFTELCEKTRAEAFAMMVSHAEEAGANAVIGVRYDATEVMSGVNEVLCYGTAVIVEPNGA